MESLSIDTTQFTTVSDAALTKDKAELWREYRIYKGHEGGAEEISNALWKYFSRKKFAQEDIQKYFHTYWSWFVDATYGRIYSLKQEEFFQLLAPTYATAHYLGYDVKKEVLAYIRYHAPTPDDIHRWYKYIREQFQAKEILVHPLVPDGWTLSQLFDQFVQSKKSNGSFTTLYETFIGTYLSESLVAEPLSMEEQQQIVVTFTQNLSFFVSEENIVDEMLVYIGRTSGSGELKEVDVEGFAEYDWNAPVETSTDDSATKQEEVLAAETKPAIPSAPSTQDILLGSTESLRGTIEWLKTFDSPKLAWNALRDRIKQQVTELDFDSANSIMQLTFFLKQNGYASEPDIVYYDQGSNTFHWNE